jgi:hypothetical protein
MSDKASSLADLAPQKQRRSGPGRPWMPGQSGNPAGRPMGLRPKVNERFLSDILADWESHGPQAIERMRKEDPGGYVRVMASLMDRRVYVRTVLDDLREMSDEELYARV